MCPRRRLVASLLFISGFMFVYYFPPPGIAEGESNVDYYTLSSRSKEINAQSTEDFENIYETTTDDSIEATSLNHVKIQCNDKDQESYYEQRGDFWVLANYFKASKTFHCDESITYTTHAEYSFLDNVQPLLERWQGPLSIGVYCPGSDFNETMKRIKYLRDCSKESELIKMYVTFHLFFETEHMPEGDIPKDPDEVKIDCSFSNPLLETIESSYRKINNLTYPINMGRMIARDMSTTYYVLPSDIELYPNPNIIQSFLDMIRRNDPVLQSPNPKVFVLTIFEADASIDHLPYNKSELIPMLRKRKVIPFHKYVCPSCHRVPAIKIWYKEPIKEGMNVFHVAKRKGRYRFWEPIYIGTKFDPGYDIRLNWEGKRDKMTQGTILAILDYEFHILDNAFLIHRPGIKRKPSVRTPFQNIAGYRQNRLINRKIYPEIIKLYGREAETTTLENQNLHNETFVTTENTYQIGLSEFIPTTES